MQHKFYRWGASYFMYTHGDKGTDQRLSNFLLNYIINNDIKGIRYKFVREGHLHKKGSVYPAGLAEIDGVVIERFPTLAAPDSYATENAYQSTRATVVTRFNKKYGQQESRDFSVAELMDI